MKVCHTLWAIFKLNIRSNLLIDEIFNEFYLSTEKNTVR